MADLMEKAKNYVVEKVGNMEKPEAEITDVDMKKVSMDSISYHANVAVKNPYSVPVPIMQISYALKCSGSVDDRAYTSTYREELKYYLRTAPEDRRRRINSLDWWRNNESQYPVLSRLARDILNVPMSTVASESAFSQGRQQLGDNRHSLGSNAMNVLVCLRDWIRAERRNQGMEPEPSDDLKLEEIMTSRENSTESSPMHGFAPVDFDYPFSICLTWANW